MAQETGIAWTDVTWNPTLGCSKVSTGCRSCYAETIALRFGMTPKPWTALNAAENVLLKPHKLREPLSKAGPWKNPCRVFVNSMSDLFHEQIPNEYIAAVFAVMAAADQHTFQILTKRPERMRDWFAWYEIQCRDHESVYADEKLDAAHRHAWEIMGAPLDPMNGLIGIPWPLANVWLGVSIENRKWVSRADVLRQTPAAVRFISAEPLLGSLDESAAGPGLRLAGIDWLIVGGESGSGHRPFDAEWARDLRDACAASGTAYFLKQLGGSRPGTALEDLPEDLRIREFPAVRP